MSALTFFGGLLLLVVVAFTAVAVADLNRRERLKKVDSQ